jgi:outer membrane lipoprotein-sorting protein
MSAIAAHMVTRILIVAALVFTSGCAAVATESTQGRSPSNEKASAHARDVERIQLRMNRQAERLPAERVPTF